MKNACWIFVLLGLVSGCCYYERSKKRREVSLASGECVVHHIRLERIGYYRASGKYCVMPGDFNEVYKEEFRFPNGLPWASSLESTMVYSEKETYQGCPECVKKMAAQ